MPVWDHDFKPGSSWWLLVYLIVPATMLIFWLLGIIGEGTQ